MRKYLLGLGLLLAGVVNAATLTTDQLYLRPGTLGTCSKAGTIAADSAASNVTKICDGTNWRQLVRTDATETLTNKDIDGGTASNSSRITLPQDTKANLDSLTRKAGTIVYATDLEQAFVDNGTILVAVGSGSGGGVPNYFVNPVCETNDTDGITDSSGILSRVASGGLSDADTSCRINSTTSGQKVIFEWSQYPNRLKNGDCVVNIQSQDANIANYKITIFQNSLQKNTAQLVFGYASQDISFQCSDDPTDLVTVEVESTVNSAGQADFIFNEGGENKNLGNSGVGPVVSYTPAFTNVTAASSAVNYQCLSSDRMAIWGNVTSTGTGAGSELRFGLPAGATINTTAAPATTIIGHGGRSSTAAASYKILSDGNSGYLTFGAQASGNATLTKLTGAQVFDAAVTFSFSAEFPVSTGCAAYKIFKVAAPFLEPTAYTPTGSWSTNTTYSAVAGCGAGGNMDFRITVATSGAPTAADLSINFLPSGFTVNTSKLPSSARNLGSATILDSGTRLYTGTVYYQSSTTVRVNHAESGNFGDVNATNPMTFASGDTITMSFSVPVNECPRPPMPLIKNAVTTSSEGVEKVNRVNISGSSGIANCTSSPCTVETSSVPGVTVTRSTTGTYAINWPAGTYSSKGACSCSANSVGVAGTRVICNAFSSATAVDVLAYREDTGGLVDVYSQVLCQGPN